MRIQTLLALVICGAITACQETAAPIAEEDRIVLEIEYVNFAWTPTYFGYVIDGTGRVFKYDRSGVDWPHADSSSFTLDLLQEKFQPVKTQVDLRDPTEVSNMAVKIDAAARGPYSEQKQECADAGTLTYRAYQYNEATARFRPVLLRVEGDFAWQNLSQQAQDLIAYIRSLDLMDELIGCDP